MLDNIGLLYLIGILLFQSNILTTKLIIYIASFTLCIKGIKIKYSKIEIILLAYLLIIFLVSKNPKLFLTLLFIIYISRLEEKKIFYLIKKFFKIGMLIFITIVIAAKLNIIDPKYFVYSALKLRNGLGFKNPNTPGIYYFILISHYYFYKWEKIKIYDYIWITVGYLFLYKYAMSRTNLIIGIFQLITILVLKKRITVSKIKKYYWSIPIIFYILSFLIAFFHTEKLNKFMTTRPLTWKLNILYQMNDMFKIFFGSIGETSPYPLDNGLLSIQYYFGIICLIIFLFLLSYGLKITNEKYLARSFILMLSYLLYSLSEDMLISPNFGIFQIFIMSNVLVKLKKQKILFEK